MNNILERFSDSDLIVELESRGIYMYDEEGAEISTPSRRPRPVTVREMLCHLFDLPSHVSDAYLLSHIAKEI